MSYDLWLYNGCSSDGDKYSIWEMNSITDDADVFQEVVVGGNGVLMLDFLLFLRISLTVR